MYTKKKREVGSKEVPYLILVKEAKVVDVEVHLLRQTAVWKREDAVDMPVPSYDHVRDLEKRYLDAVKDESDDRIRIPLCREVLHEVSRLLGLQNLVHEIGSRPTGRRSFVRRGRGESARRRNTHFFPGGDRTAHSVAKRRGGP